MAFCPNCGTEVQGRFCAKCGSPVEAAPQQPQPQAPPQGYTAPPGGYTPPPGYTAPPPGGYQPPPPGYQPPPPGGYAPPPPGGFAPQSAGLTDNMAAALCYLLGVLTGILFLVLAPYNQNRAIRFHAFQSIFFWVAAESNWKHIPCTRVFGRSQSSAPDQGLRLRQRLTRRLGEL